MKNLKLIGLAIVMISQISLVSAIDHSNKPEKLEEKQFEEFIQKYQEQIEKTDILIDDLLPIIYGYAGVELIDNTIEQSNNLARSISTVDFEGIKKAVENGAYINFRYPNGDTPLLRVLGKSQEEKKLYPIVEYLIKNGADVNLKNQGDTPLVIAIDRKFYNIANLLIQNESNLNYYYTNLNFKDVEGQTALISAAKNGIYELVKKLIERRADSKIRDDYGKTAYDYARYRYLSGSKGGFIESDLENYKKIMDLLSPEAEAIREEAEAKREKEEKRLQGTLLRIQQQEIEESVRKFDAKKALALQEERQRQEEERLRVQRAQEAMSAAAAQPMEEEGWAEETAPAEEEGWGNIEQED